MSRNAILNYLSLSRSLSGRREQVRQFRLPRINPFPRLDSTALRSAIRGEQRPVASRPVAGCGGLIAGVPGGQLPEMATDVIDTAAAYAVGNVKRERSNCRPGSRIGFGHLIGRVLAGHRAARQ
jgi:hypothetical protein